MSAHDEHKEMGVASHKLCYTTNSLVTPLILLMRIAPLFHIAQNALLVTQQMRDSENIRRKRFITDARV